MERRRKAGSILLRIGSKNRVKIEPFPATEWPNRPGARPGNFRLRVDGQWFGDDKYAFHSLPELGALVADAFAGLAGLDGERVEDETPDLPRGTWVRIQTWQQDGMPWTQKARTLTEPMQGRDGRWYVCVNYHPVRFVMVPVNELEIIGRTGA